MTKKRSATVKATSIRPKRPKVDRGEEFEQLVRKMFFGTVERWCKDNLDEQPNKDARGNVVDNLTACWTSALETTVDAATDSYLSTAAEAAEDDDEDEEDDDDDEEEEEEEEEEEDDDEG